MSETKSTGSQAALAQRLEALSPAAREVLLRKLQGLGGAARPRPAGPPPLEARGALEAPLAFAQERIWFLEQLEPGNRVYLVPAALRLTGELDVAALRAALGGMVRRHGALRTVFVLRDDEPRQVVGEAPPSWPLPLVDLTRVPEPRRRRLGERLAERETHRTFDLERGPVFRSLLLRTGAREHLLVLVMHHLVTDGWSVGILVQELAEIYRAALDKRPARLGAVPAQYTDYAVWQRGWLRGERLEQEFAFWEKTLAGAADDPGWLTDRPRRAVQRYLGGRLVFQFPAALSTALGALARRADASLFMVLLAAFNTLVVRYGGSRDQTVSTPIANRAHEKLEGVVGCFINMLVLRNDASGDPTFLELLGRARGACLDAFAHQELPFSKLVERLQPDRNLSRNPLFQVMLILQNAPMKAFELPGLRLEGVATETGTTPLELSLDLLETGDGLLGNLVYDIDLFDRSTMRRLVGHFERLLRAAAADPSRRLSALPMLGEGEAHQVLIEWNDSDAPEAAADWLPDLFAAQAARTPDRLALARGDERLSYGELARRVERAAAGLAQVWRARAGAGRESVVALLGERGPVYVEMLLALLRAGGVYLPLDPAWPEERLAAVLERSDAAILVAWDGDGAADSALGGRLAARPEVGARLLTPAAAAALGAAEGAWRRPLGDPRQLAYLLFTSGSTGLPKGVMIRHQGLVNNLRSKIDDLGLEVGDAVAQTAAQAFDISVWQLLAALPAGGRIEIYGPRITSDPLTLLRRAADDRIAVLQIVPSVLGEMLYGGGADIDRLDALRWLIVTGEACPPELCRRWLARRPGQRMLNAYGPAETSDDVTQYFFGAASRRGAELEPSAEAVRLAIGRPLPNLKVYNLDPALRPAPLGGLGEICVGGLAVGRGYVGEPAKTAAVFVPDPFGEPGARLYRSGDLGRLLADGVFEFHGRHGQQIKLRGVRMELGEIEAVLGQSPRVREAVVALRDDLPGGPRLVAYAASTCAASTEEPAEEPLAAWTEALREHLRARLPDAMVPGLYVRLDHLPRTANGKIDRRALPRPEVEEARATTAPEAPRGTTETMLAGLAAAVLGVERVGRDESFFDLGGHSLLATRLLARLREAFGVELPLRTLFEHASVAELAPRVEAARRRMDGAPMPPLERAPRQADAPLSFAQQRLWFLHRYAPESAFYNMAGALRLRGPLDVDHLAAALGDLARRHESLRTVYVERGGTPRQRVLDPAPWPLPTVDVEKVGGLEAAQTLLEEAAAEPFDLAEGPVARALLARLAEHDHLLLLAVHHIAADGWSVGLMLAELQAHYAARRVGGTAELPELAVQYLDYALWQRQWLRGAVLEGQIEFWRRRLADVVPLDLPTDRPRPAREGHDGAARRGAWSTELRRGVEELARRRGATPNMVVLAALEAVLGRWSGQRCFAIGMPVSGRNHPALEPLVGFFVNSLAVRAEVSARRSFADHLAEVRGELLAAQDHQDLPFEQLVEALDVERDLGRSPIFQVVLAWESFARAAVSSVAGAVAGAGGEEAFGMALEEHPLAVRTAKFDLTLGVIETAEGYAASLEYRTDLFDPTTAERLLRGVERLLADAVAAPERRLGEFALVGRGEAHQLLVEPRPAVVRAAPVPVHRRVLERAAVAPDAVALVLGGAALSYGELASRADRLAGRLRGLGVGRGERVGIRLERSLDLVVALLGVLEAGGGYVPLDPSYPEDRLRFLAEDARCRVVLTGESLAGLLGDEEGGGGGDVGEDATLDDLAYVIYTSGSTGRPKGVEVTHRQVARLLTVSEERFAFAAADVWTLFHSSAFDFSVWEIWGALCHGARLVVVPYWLSRDPAAFRDLLVRERVSVLNQTPSAFLQLDAVDARAANPAGFEALRLVIFGGEALAPESLAGWLGRRPARPELVNMYGITETTVHVTWRRIDAGDTVSGRGSVLGVPLPDLGAWVVDPALRPAPLGAPGEIYVGGGGVARGYLGRPALTAERFVPDPWSEVAGARLYRTGDRAKRLPSGELVYLGRVDEQVKVRGFRIEPGEVEAALREHPEVGEAAVAVRADAAGGAQLVAWVTAATAQGAPRLDKLRDDLAARLPVHLVPTAWSVVDALPRTPSGKLDRRSLPTPEIDAAAGRAEHIPPATPLQESLAAIWSSVLGVPRVGLGDNFFSLGGHSLLATQVVARTRDLFGVELPLRRLFETPTLGAVAEALEDALRDRDGRPAPPPLVRVERDRRQPLSFAQRRLWLIDQLGGGESSAYVLPIALRLGGRLRRDALRASLAALARRHEAFRTRFLDHGGEPYQRVLPASEVAAPWAEIDLSALAPAARETVSRRLATRLAARPFDLAVAPLLCAALLRLGDAEHVVVLATHHIVADEWSAGVMTRELTVLYDALSRGVAVRLPALAVQYVDFAAWQHAWLVGEERERQLDYWRGALAGIPELLELPADRVRPARQSFRGGSRAHRLDAASAAALVELAAELGITPHMLFLAAFQALLGRLAGQSDIVVSSGVGNRARTELEGVLGPFINILLLRADLSGDPSLRRLAASSRETVLGAYAHQDIPFQMVVDALRPERDPSYNPLTQVMLVLHNAPEGERVELPELAFEPFPLASAGAQLDLILHLRLGEAGLGIGAQYASDLFDPTTIDRALRSFERLLRAWTTDPDLPLSRLPLLGPGERHQVCVEWNDTAAAFPRRAGLHELFAEQARRRPHGLAAACDEDSLTYGELDARSDRLASLLASRGVGPGTVVGLCLERSTELIVCLLGILKSGAGYVPLDPSYPADRLAFMLEDSGSGFLISHGALASALPETELETLWIDRDPLPEVSSSTGREADAATRMLYTIYTSGSTGRPKGVLLDHRGRVNNFSDVVRSFDYGPEDRVFCPSSPSFDMFAHDVYTALISGAAVILPPAGRAADPEVWKRLARRWEISIWHSVPALLDLYIDAVLDDPAAAPPRLRLAILGGDWIPVGQPDRLRRIAPEVVFIAQGGATEVSADSTLYSVGKVDPVWASIPYGRPMTNQRAVILDRRGELCPLGVTGELLLGGVGPAWGYRGRGALTAEKFIPDPFSPDAGAKLYRTGDIARLGVDGQIELLGRVDNQVKIRGLRIELGEIEAALRARPEVEDVVVAARGEGEGRRLVAYWVAASEVDPASRVAALREALAVSLPTYMVPSVFVPLTALPLTPNGKLDRKGLPDPAVAAPRPAGEQAPPTTPTELRLAEILRQVLELESVGIDDDFFHLGGDSFHAIRIVRRYGEPLTLMDLFRHPSIRELAAQLDGASGGEPGRGGDEGLLVELRPGRPGGLTLVCLPYAGGAATIYHPLAQVVADDTRLLSAALPGHDPGRPDEALESYEEIAERCFEALRRNPPERLAIYSHCGASALALLLVRRLEEAGIRPLGLFLAASLPKLRIPLWTEVVAAVQPEALVPDGSLFAWLRSMGAFTDVVDPDAVRLTLRNLRHDLQCMRRTYGELLSRRSLAASAKLETPVCCVIGEDDPQTVGYARKVKRFERLARSVELVVLPGAEHYFVKHRPRDVADVITAFLQGMSADAASRQTT